MKKIPFILCFLILIFTFGCSKKNTVEVVAPPDDEDCKLARKVYEEDGEWKVAIFPGHSMISSYPKNPKCIEKEKEMEKLYIKHILKKE
ncbi:hypothetical protein [Desulfopila inferna]|uniref:hypothetical protein n=1 Tax=Desulfopila inferna TaxID=468528 RepID=UPI001965CF22|nr:hypothetical protein [Desulfopila inferna]MBM9606750.1 hypothetical protein [Desulfopila inferna]